MIQVTKPLRSPEASLPTPDASPQRPKKTRRTQKTLQYSEDEDRCFDRVKRDPFQVRLHVNNRFLLPPKISDLPEGRHARVLRLNTAKINQS